VGIRIVILYSQIPSAQEPIPWVEYVSITKYTNVTKYRAQL